MKLHALIVKEPPLVSEIVREIGFLFKKDLVTRQTLHAVVMVCCYRVIASSTMIMNILFFHSKLQRHTKVK